jgi:hypothetical protein
MGSYSVDILAVGFFIFEWLVYAIALEQPPTAATACRRG